MEENLTPNEEVSTPSQLSFTSSDFHYLSETGNWTKFLAILGFIFIGLIVVFSLFAGTIFAYVSQESGAAIPSGFGIIMTIIYLFMGLIYFFPAWYLFKFSRNIKTAVQTKNNENLTEALRNQKSFYKFWGGFTILFLGLYLIFGLISLLLRL